MTFRISLLLMFAALRSGAGTYYVDPVSGSDTNSGSATNLAWRSIPGTMGTNGSTYLSSTWGAFNSGASKVPSGTTVLVKSGALFAATNFGPVNITRDYWTETGSNIVVATDTGWGDGTPARFNGTGVGAGIAMILVQVDGVTVSNLTVINSPVEGIEFKEHQGSGNPLMNCNAFSLSISNSGTSYLSDAAGAGAGQLSLRWPSNMVVRDCVFSGGNQYINGLLIGDDHKYPTNVTVISCVATNHRGDVIGNDAGSGFKTLNATVTFTNCLSAWNLKGWDCGEAHGDNVGFNARVISSTAATNWQGFNFNSAGAAYSGDVSFLLLNSLAVRNTDKGQRAYAGPFTLTIAHSVFDSNGLSDTNEGSNVHFTPDTQYETNAITARLYNCILIGPGGCQIMVPYFATTNQFTLDSDFNSYQQRASEYFCRWSYYVSPAVDFSYGANGPGHSSGNWFSWYGTTTTPPLRGTGHFGADANSTGTGASNTNTPALTSAWAPSSGFAGTSLSGKSWYTAEMGLDRSGRTRTRWDLGMYEFIPPITIGTATVGTLTTP